MPGLDLMPRTCREAITRRTWARRWVVAYLVAILTVIGGQWLISSRNESRRSTLEKLSTQVRDNLLRNEERTRLLKSIEASQRIIARYNRIAWPVRVSGVMGSIAQAMPKAVSLSSLALTPRRTNEQRSRAAKGSAKTEPNIFLVVEMEGVAPDDLELARFVSGLESHGLFQKVTLDFARSSELRGQPVRVFRMSAEVDLLKSYRFSQAGEDTP